MEELLEGLAVIGGFVFGGIIILLMAPVLDPLTPVNLTRVGFLFLAVPVILIIVIVLLAVGSISSEL